MTKINEVLHTNQIADLVKNNQQPIKNKSVDFASTVKEFLNTVNNKQKESAQATSDIIQGKSENLAEAMTKSEEAHLHFQLMLEIRNKVMESYKEIKRITV